MGVRVEVAGVPYEAEDYSVIEEATPLTLDDTSQGVGSFSVTVVLPEEIKRYRPEATVTDANRLWSPLPVGWDFEYDPTHYSVTVQDPTNPHSPVRVQRTALGGSTPVLIRSLVQPLSGAREPIYLTAELQGTVTFSPGRLPPNAPSSVASWNYTYTKTAGSVWVFETPEDDAPEGISYPYTTPVSFELAGAVGEWIEFHRAHVGSSTAGGDIASRVGDDPIEVEMGGEWKIKTAYSWAGPRAASPSRALITAEPLTPTSHDRVVTTSRPVFMRGDSITLIDTNKGMTSGTVREVTHIGEGRVTLDCDGGLAGLNAYNVTAQPTDLTEYAGFEGTLREAVQYYASLAGVGYVFVDPSVAERPVSFPGWVGETWYHLKQLATSQGCEISFVSGYPVFRPIRGRTTEPGRWLDRSLDVSEPDKALTVEAYSQNVRAIRDKYVIHPNIGTPEVLSAAPGEEAEFILDIPASVYRLTYVAAFFTDDRGWGLSWEGSGANVVLNPKNSSQVIVTLAPPTDLRTERVYVGRLVNGERIPGLYVRASGVSLDPVKLSVATGTSPRETGTNVGATLDSPFLTTPSAATLAARTVSGRSSGDTYQLSGTVTNVNRRGDSGVGVGSTYLQAAQLMDDEGVVSYGDAQGWTEMRPTGDTYNAQEQYFDSTLTTDYAFQEFGNVAGSRIWDAETRRWFRVRQAVITRSTLRIQAEDDLTLGEAVQPWTDSGFSYQQIYYSIPSYPWADSGSDRISYFDVERMGVASVG